MVERLDRARQVIAERELDAALISLPANRFYLTGFSADDHGPDASSGVLLVGRSSATLLTSATNAPWAASEARPTVEVAVWERPWENHVGTRLREAGWRRVGFEDAALSVASHRALISAAGDDVALEPIGDAVSRLRATKDEVEVDLLTAAIRLTDEVFVAATADLRAGITERALAWRIEREMRERGADGPAFPTIVAAGPHSARPHHAPTARPIAEGEPIIIDMGVRLGGYAADLTRTVWLAEPTSRLVEVYNVVRTAQQAALSAVRAGISAREVDAAAREVIAGAGYGERFTHPVGHGLGIRIHEAPSLAQTSDETLAADQVVTVEPGIYIADWGGVRVEDVGLIEATGIRVLTAAPKL